MERRVCVFHSLFIIRWIRHLQHRGLKVLNHLLKHSSLDMCKCVCLHTRSCDVMWSVWLSHYTCRCARTLWPEGVCLSSSRLEEHLLSRVPDAHKHTQHERHTHTRSRPVVPLKRSCTVEPCRCSSPEITRGTAWWWNLPPEETWQSLDTK